MTWEATGNDNSMDWEWTLDDDMDWEATRHDDDMDWESTM